MHEKASPAIKFNRNIETGEPSNQTRKSFFRKTEMRHTRVDSHTMCARRKQKRSQYRIKVFRFG